MRKILLTALVALLAVLGVQAQSRYTLGYCNHEIAQYSSYGSDVAGEISAAIYVPKEKLKTLAGNNITEIAVGLVSRINVRDLTVWVRSSLDGSNLASGSIERGRLGWNEIALSAPFTIPADNNGLYFGYTFKNAGSSHPVSFVGAGSANQSFLKTSANGSWQDMQNAGNLSVEAYVEGSNLPLYDLALNSASVSPDLSQTGNVYTVSGVVSNVALCNVSGFTVRVSSADGTTADAVVDSAVVSGGEKNFTASVSVDKPLSGNVTVSIVGLADGTDANADNNTVSVPVSFTHNLLVEEFTTERCSNCPDAATALHTALASKAEYGERVIAVSHHSAFGTDWLTQGCDTTLLKLFNDNGMAFAPAFMFDRHAEFDANFPEGTTNKDNVYSTKSASALRNLFDRFLPYAAHAGVGIHINNVAVDGDSTSVNLTVNIQKDDEFALSNPMLTIYVIEDNVPGKYQQGGNGTVDGYVHQHVIRAFNSAWGDPVTFDGNSFTKDYTIGISNDWKKADLKVVAFISNYDPTDILKSDVANAVAVKYPTSTTDGIKVVAKSVGELHEVARYNVNGQQLNAPQHGVNIVKYNDGSVRKIFVK